MVAKLLNLVDDFAVEIGSDYQQSFKICGINLSEYTGQADIKLTIDSPTALSMSVDITGVDILTLSIPNVAYPVDIEPGMYLYDVLLTHNTNSKKIYLMYGEVELIQRVTT